MSVPRRHPQSQMPSTRTVAAEHGASALNLRVKGTFPGALIAAGWRWRRAPRQAVRAALANRSASHRGAEPSGRQRCRAVYVVLAGQDEGTGLADLLESIACWDGDATGVVVLDDATTDCRAADVLRWFPRAVVLRHRWPRLAPPYQYPGVARLLREVVRRFDAEVVVKIDTDALLTGPGLGERAAGVFAEHPEVGLLGTIERSSYDAWVIERERRRSRAVRRLAAAASSAGHQGDKAHGGIYVLSRAALDGMAAAGWLDWRPPPWTLLNEDACVGLAVAACGLRVGWPVGEEWTLSVSHRLPVSKTAITPADVLAVHSVRRGLDGETEPELRAFLRDLRRDSQPHV